MTGEAHSDETGLRSHDPATARSAGRAVSADEDRCQAVLEQLPNSAVFLFDRELRHQFAAGAALADLGLARELVEGRTGREFLPTRLYRLVERYYRAALSGRASTFEAVHAGRALLCNTVPVRSRSGSVVAGLAVIQDVTRLKEAEERQRFLAEASMLLGSSLDYPSRLAQLVRRCVPQLGDFCLLDVVMEGGGIHRVEAAHVNPEKSRLVRQLLLYSPQEGRSDGVSVALRSRQSVLVDEVTDATRQAMAQTPEHLDVLRRLAARSYLTIPLAAGAEILGAITFAMAESGRGFRAGEVALAEALASRAAQAMHHERLYQKAQHAVRAREEILSVVSHELRDPLSATLLMLDMLRDSSDGIHLSGRQRQQLGAIHGYAEQMVHLVDDLLDVARIESGYLPIRPAAVEIVPLVRDAVELSRPLADACGVRLDTDLPAALPAGRIDSQRILQVFSNLLDNAIRQVPAGGTITVGAEVAGADLRVTISDTGPGIAAEQLSEMFAPDAPARRTPRGGLGIGLAVASGIVRGHGGDLWAEPMHDRGSALHFTLPVAAGAEAPVQEPTLDAFPPAVPTFASVRHDAAPAVGAETRENEHGHDEGHERRAHFFAELNAESTPAPSRNAAELGSVLRHRIMAAVHLGRLRPGDRLPSIREIARQFRATHHTTVQVYEDLAAEGLIEKRERSGIFVADPARRCGSLPVETARWLADVLTEATEHQIRIPRLPDLIRSWTAEVRLRCACVESDLDHLTALCTGIDHQFGIECVPVLAEELRGTPRGSPVDPASLPQTIRTADILATTSFHAPTLRAAADALGKPLVVVTADPEVVAIIDRALAERRVTLVCADPRFGERIRSLRGRAMANRIRVVLATDTDAVQRLNLSVPVLLTRAAREQLGDVELRLLTPHYPAFSLRSAREVAELLIQLNLSERRLVVRRPSAG